MDLHIDALEVIWIITNTVALLLTALALIEAWQGLAVATGGARRILARGNVRREVLRLIVQFLLLLIVAPGLFTERPTPLNLFVLILMAIPAILLASTMLDAYDRRRLVSLVWSDIEAERGVGLDRIEEMLKENTVLTKDAGKKADAAYKEANSVNNKIANLQKEGVAIQKANRPKSKSPSKPSKPNS